MACNTLVNASVAPAVRVAAPAARKSALAPAVFGAKTNEWAKKTVSNGIKTSAMQVWQPLNNKFFETFSYLPPLTDQEIARQVDYVTGNNWTPCLEFASEEQAYVSDVSCVRFGAVTSGYQDNRYWTLWKLPMFGCTDPRQVLDEISNCRKAFPQCYIRLVAFDAARQVQITGFLVQRPSNARDYQSVTKRSVY